MVSEKHNFKTPRYEDMDDDDIIRDMAESLTVKEFMCVLAILGMIIAIIAFASAARADLPEPTEAEAYRWAESFCIEHRLSCPVDGEGAIILDGVRYVQG